MTEAEDELAGLDLGPHMQALTTKQRLFVLNYVMARGNATEAAFRSGYGAGDRENCRKIGSHLMQNPKILRGIKEDGERRLNAAAGLSAEVLVQLLDSPKESVRQKAAEHILSLAGINPVTRHEHVHVHETNEAITAEIRKMAKQLGLDESKLLGYSPPTDAEFTEVTILEEEPAFMEDDPEESIEW